MSSAGRILIVDDNRTSRRKLGLAVKQLGHDWVDAENGASALAILARENFDLILLEIQMPEMDGFEVLSRLRADHRLATVPVLVISGLHC